MRGQCSGEPDTRLITYKETIIRKETFPSSQICFDELMRFLPQVLLPASSILQMSSVREACCKFLMRQLHPTNCLGIRNFADTHACKELHKRSHKFALENFQEVMSTEEFLLLPFQEVCMWMLK